MKSTETPEWAKVNPPPRRKAPSCEQHGRATLTNAQVREIRQVYATKGDVWTIPALAKEFGVPYATMYGICRGRTWKGLPQEIP